MKGVSELISSVLIVVVTITIAVIVFSFYTSTVVSTTDKVTNKSAEAVDCASASISIDGVYVTNGTAGNARVIVRNSGLADLVMTSAQLYNKTGYNFSATGLPITGFNKGVIATVSFSNISLKSCPNDFSRVIVSTNCGGVSRVFDGTPSCT